ncbi:hypothetical protein [Streptomyces sp. NP-1717]|uniref:hypothetical protein n=1 Tax=Streptomyces sp. NP-1717 TaxID=2704470 RepID=UPI001F5DD36A|nr:hypothetical protein [Streptomyces sp. NP-1717]MCI3227195.1 hypothetical protein [Streptomyces sp. NP-1717]
MNQLLVTLGTKLTERWLNLLVLPGALFLGVLAAGTTLGHAHWHDLPRLGEALDDLTARPALDRAGTAAVAVAAVLLLSSALSLAAQFLGSAVESFWLRESRFAFDHHRQRARLRAWERLTRERNAAIRDPAAKAAEIRRLDRARARIGLVPPSRPTWYGDRLQAAGERVEAVYGLDLDAVWPRLWLILAEPAQRQIEAARASFTAAARLGAWSLAYLAVAAWWWPAVLIAAGCALVARSRAHESTEALASLVEAAVDVHGRDLAVLVGLEQADVPGPLPVDTGDRLSETFRKAGLFDTDDDAPGT